MRATGGPPIACYGLWCRSTDRWGLMVVAVARGPALLSLVTRES